MFEMLTELVEQLSVQSKWEWLAFTLALAYVWLAAKQYIWCWPAAFVSTSIYTWLFWEVSLPFHVVLNAYYVAMAVYGWWQWNQPKKAEGRVVQWSIVKHLTAICLLAAMSLSLSYLARQVLDAEYLYLDAFITVFSVFTTYLVTQKVVENWLYWMVINSFATFLYFQKGLYPTSLLYALYMVFAIYGYMSWRKDAQQGMAMESKAVA